MRSATCTRSPEAVVDDASWVTFRHSSDEGRRRAGVVNSPGSSPVVAHRSGSGGLSTDAVSSGEDSSGFGRFPAMHSGTYTGVRTVDRTEPRRSRWPCCSTLSALYRESLSEPATGDVGQHGAVDADSGARARRPQNRRDRLRWTSRAPRQRSLPLSTSWRCTSTRTRPATLTGWSVQSRPDDCRDFCSAVADSVESVFAADQQMVDCATIEILTEPVLRSFRPLRTLRRSAARRRPDGGSGCGWCRRGDQSRRSTPAVLRTRLGR